MKYYAIARAVQLAKANDVDALRAALPLDKEMIICENEQDAIDICAARPTNDKDLACAIYAVEFKGTKGRKAETFVLSDDKSVNGFVVTPNNTNEFKVYTASLTHVDAKYAIVDLTKAAAPVVVDAPKAVDAPVAPKADDKKDDAKADDKKDDAKTEETSSSFGLAAIGVAIFGTGFWYSGMYTTAIASLAKLGLVLPAASIAVQVGLSVAVGLAVVGFISAISYGFNKVFGGEAVDTRNADEKYHDELKTAEEKVKLESDKLTSDKDKDFFAKLTAILDVEHAAERTFENGALKTEQPAANDKLLALQFEAAKLAEVTALEGDARVAKETETLEAAKTAAAKKFA